MLRCISKQEFDRSCRMFLKPTATFYLQQVLRILGFVHNELIWGPLRLPIHEIKSNLQYLENVRNALSMQIPGTSPFLPLIRISQVDHNKDADLEANSDTTELKSIPPPTINSKASTRNFSKRIKSELRMFGDISKDGIFLRTDTTDTWIIDMLGPPGSLYENETFSLRVRFPELYPIESPEVVFIGVPPVHPHVYSNGHICLSILYSDWTPVLTVSGICLSIQSMLSSCKSKKLPPFDDMYCKASVNTSPKFVSWIFEDEHV